MEEENVVPSAFFKLKEELSGYYLVHWLSDSGKQLHTIILIH